MFNASGLQTHISIISFNIIIYFITCKIVLIADIIIIIYVITVIYTPISRPLEITRRCKHHSTLVDASKVLLRKLSQGEIRVVTSREVVYFGSSKVKSSSGLVH